MDPNDDRLEYEKWREMAEIRAVGKGSRGGPGAAKRRKKKRHPTPRRRSKRQNERAGDATQLIIDELRNELFDGCRANTQELLTEKFKLQLDDDAHPAAFWKAIAASKQRRLVRKANARYLDAVTYAYAIYAWVLASGLNLEVHVKMIAESAGIPVNSNFDLLATILRLVIDYDDEDVELRKFNRKYRSRDAQAIRYLEREKIPPHEVEAYQEKHGGGVDSWSRLASKTSTRDKKVRAAEIKLLDSWRQDNDLRQAGYKSLEDYLDDKKSEGVVISDPEAEMPDEILLELFAQKMLSPDEVMLVVLVKDANAPGGVHVAAKESLGALRRSIATMKPDIRVLTTIAKRLLSGRPLNAWDITRLKMGATKR